jgi:ADP-ribosylarginine hydrolase
MGGLSNISVRGWSVSDDTVMHLATMRAIVQVYTDLSKIEGLTQTQIIDKLMTVMAQEYIICWDDMNGRAPGATCGSGVRFLSSNGIKNWNKLPYSSYGGGCGGSMRAMAIGLAFSGQEQRDMLVAIGIEAGRLTHNHPTGFLGSLVSGAFTAYAIEGIPANQWGYHLINDLIPRARSYLEKTQRDWSRISDDMNAFVKQWTKYLQARGLEALNNNGPVFPEQYGPEERDDFNVQFSFRGWAGASGDDSVIIAYDALLGAGDNWEECMFRGAFHAGDSDSTGTIAAAWWGAIHGFNRVPPSNYQTIEKRTELIGLAKKLFQIKQQQQQNTSE